MPQNHHHDSHPRISARLKRANGHLRKVIEMIESGAPCTAIAQQLQAVEKAISNAKRELIFDHIDHCLPTETEDKKITTDGFKTITRYL